MLIVIGGDSYYKDEDEEDRSVISRWSRRKVASQFNEEYLDGRKSFIFSWDTKHRPIHEEALRHYLDPSKKGFKFVYTPKPKPLPIPAKPEDARQQVELLPCYILSACEIWSFGAKFMRQKKLPLTKAVENEIDKFFPPPII